MELQLAVAYAVFCLIKFLGYSGFAAVLKRVYRTERPHALWIGLFRTGLGMVVGAGLWGLTVLTESPFVPLVGLPLVRVGEWGLTLWLFHDRKLETPARDVLWTFFGILLSFALDTPVLLGLLVFGRGFVC